MATKKKGDDEMDFDETSKPEIKQIVPKPGPIDLRKRVEVITSDSAPYHKPGEKILVSPTVAEKMKANGWVKTIIFFLLFGIGATASAQLQDLKSEYSLTSDTLTNTGTTFLSSQRIVKEDATTTAVQINFTKLSGTAAGTATLQGSLDNVTFATIDTTTFTVANVTTQSKVWTMVGSPVIYYRVSVVGSGIQSVRMTGKVYTH